MSESEFSDTPLRFDDTEFEEEKAPRLPKPDYTRATKTTGRAKAKTTPPYKEGKLLEPITLGYGFFGMGIGMLEVKYLQKPHMPIGTTIVESAEQCAKAWDKAAQNSPAVRRVLYRLVESSTLMMVAAAHTPIAVAVATEMPATQNLAKKVIGFLERTMGHATESYDATGQTYPS
jgi:hypothetical protein